MSINGIARPYRTNSNYSPGKATNRDPDWSKVPHKGMERPSDTEFDAIINDLAKSLGEAIAAGDDKKYSELRAYAEKEVLAQYISIVSPDRKGMVEEAQPLIKLAMSGQLSASSKVKKADDPQTLFDYMSLKNGSIKPMSDEDRKVSLDSTGGEFQYGLNDLTPDMFKINSSTGNTVLSYNGESHGWAWTPTPIEMSKQQEFLARLNTLQDYYSKQTPGSETQNSVRFDKVI